MTEHNVVSLNEYGKRRPAMSAEHQAILNECRDLLASGVARVLSRQAEAIENSLISLADRSPLLETRNLYFGAQGIVHQRGTELFQACKDAFAKAFDRQAMASDTSRPTLAIDELSLVEDTDFEVTLAVNKSSSRLRFHCAEELVGLDVRMGVLTGRPQLAPDDNPAGPRTICEAILDAFNALGLELKVQLVLLNQFDLMLYPELPALYQEVNQLLVKRGVLPDFKIGARQAPFPHRPVQARRDEQAEIQNLLDQLLQSPAMRESGSVSAGLGSNGAAPGAVAHGGSIPNTSLLGMSMVEALHHLQAGALALPSGVTIDLRPIQASGITNVVRELQQSPVMLSASQLEAVLIDAVAMLFDYLFEDRAIPDQLKSLIARLQVPILKLAIIDRSFFSNRDHPARQVLDLLGSLVVKTGDEPSAPDPLLEEVKATIEHILRDFDQDASVFEQAAYALMALRARREHELESGMAIHIADLQRAERRENAESVALEHIRRALADQPSPPAIVNFLREVWKHQLSREYIEGGESSPHLSAHLETMRELLWSVQPKSDMDSRLMLVRILPGLLKRLREGVHASAMSPEAAEKFFSELVALHANAVRSHPQSVPLPQAETLFEDLPEATVDTEAPATESVAHGAAPEAEEIADEFSERAAQLQKGAWVEFHYEDGTFRWARLGWVSGLKGQYLFSDADGLNTFSITPQRLAEKLRTGEAVLVERRSPTDTAFGKLFTFFRQRLAPA